MTSVARDASGYNEDFAIATDRIAIVVDGAGVPTSGCIHGVPWYAQNLGVQTLAALTADPDQSLAAGLSLGIQRVADMHSSTCDLRDGMTPCAAVGVARLTDHCVETLSLADVAVVIQGPEIGVVVNCDLNIERLCGAESEILKGLRIGAPGHDDALVKLVHCQTENRNRANGWWVAAANPDAAYCGDTTSVSRGEVREIAVMSDGATRPVDQMAIYGWSDYLNRLKSVGPQELIKCIRKIELSDPFGARYPRTKCHDDASIALCSLIGT